MPVVLQIFKKYRSVYTKTRHFKRKIIFLAPRPLRRRTSPSPGTQPSGSARLFARIPARSTPVDNVEDFQCLATQLAVRQERHPAYTNGYWTLVTEGSVPEHVADENSEEGEPATLTRNGRCNGAGRVGGGPARATVLCRYRS